MKNLLFILSFLFTLVSSGFAQEQESGTHRPQIRAAILMANSHVPNSTSGEKKVSILPTWGFDVDYFFHRKWSLALQGDVKVQSFEVEQDGVILERSYPVAFAGVIHYHALRHWSFYFGPGYEFEKSENLFLVKMGTEYSFEITEDFEIALNLAFENKDNVYDTWTFGVAFNKKIWEKK
ncbi:MAG: hypothetical protein PSV36_09500 [Algoriphagus sp.]|nr:hypothetical protein [Algoriphagus sp.]